MKNLLILLSVDVLLAGTTIYMGCFGLPIQDNNEDTESPSRLTRSLHALQSQLCPEGSSSERCFYSQLSMFMRMQDSLMDPVALRNIGKRNSPHDQNENLDQLQNEDSANTGLGLISDPNIQIRLLQLRNFAAMLNGLKNLLDHSDASSHQNGIKTSQFASFLFTPSGLPDGQTNGLRQKGLNQQIRVSTKAGTEPSINNMMERFLGFNPNSGNENSEVIESQMKRNIASHPSLEKRQIICSSASSRLECYDNALAYYVRLLKTLKSH
ncbi:uncharacterized protein LOC123536483 [Mercenaria mercenaria]|uniref:uncharacterized protein LOC123536483 n=1 Tax=Mercenaria mercenaria TaxID=6596 RepID=UPI00234E7D17|nr:uncharacterized protein LOC123536483 [Mercenaria mercenaria]